MLRLMADVGVPSAAPYGFVELTPQREYLLVAEFLAGGKEILESEVSRDTIRDAVELWPGERAARNRVIPLFLQYVGVSFEVDVCPLSVDWAEDPGAFVTDFVGEASWAEPAAGLGIVAIQQASAACCSAVEDAVLSGAGFESGWHPGVAVEEAAECVELGDAPFRGGGEVGLDDSEVGESVEGAPAAS